MALYLAKIFGDVEKAARANAPKAPMGTNESPYVDERRALAAATNEGFRVKRGVADSYWEYKLRKVVKEAAKVALKKAAAREARRRMIEQDNWAEEEDEEELERLGIKAKGQP